MLLKTAMEPRAGQRNYLNAIMSRFDEMQLIYYTIKTKYTVMHCIFLVDNESAQVFHNYTYTLQYTYTYMTGTVVYKLPESRDM